jgi:hypothetical protein
MSNVRSALTLALVVTGAGSTEPVPARVQTERRLPGTTAMATASLRDQIDLVAGDSVDSGTFNFDLEADMTYDWRNGGVNIYADVTVTGKGQSSSTLDGGGVGDFFRIQDRGKLTLKDLTLANGKNQYASAVWCGGVLVASRVTFQANSGGYAVIYVEGTSGTATLSFCVMEDNTVKTGGYAGALYVTGGRRAIVTSTRFANNKGAAPGGALAGAIGAYAEDTVITVDSNTFVGNTGSYAGAISQRNGAAVYGAASCSFYDGSANSQPVCTANAGCPAQPTPPPTPPLTPAPTAAPKSDKSEAFWQDAAGEIVSGVILSGVIALAGIVYKKRSAAQKASHRVRDSDNSDKGKDKSVPAAELATVSLKNNVAEQTNNNVV